ncbi:unnamed protein product [Alternaria alternata]|uniref:Structural maintenance of chromosomes protein 5 n=1 Tax=Alternaria alternata TaxID=5599 RepID=A0A4Q4N2E5_ALTAL|nr:Structural maintenance of chromosomes protein 5 [Alternaria alternata]
MPGIVQRGRKRPSRAVSEDEDEESSASSSPPSSASKRARYEQNAPNGSLRTNGHRNGSNAHAQDDFKPGSLVRVKLTNFVTYTAAEFHLGPSLNMIIGPNGTGKSTLVCAICLGLGWNSEHLGRAKELGQFVKHGATEAVIEIELATGSGKGPNRIVKRLIRKEDNKSVFFLEDRRVTQKDVVAMAKGYSIQIDNLCQFLPQDRVVAFSMMSDVDRLRETQRAAAPPYMVEWHDQLKALRVSERSKEDEQTKQRESLEKSEKQQTSLRGDVDRHHQRENLQREAKCLEMVRPMIEMKDLKTNINNIKAEIREARLELDQINVDIEPARQAQSAVEAYQDQIQQVVRLRKNRVDMIKTQADNIARKVDAEKTKAAESTAMISAELASKKTSEQDMVRLNHEIVKLKQQQSSEPEHYDAESYEQRKAALRNEISTRAGLVVEKENILLDMRNRRVPDISRQNEKLKADRARLSTQSGKQASLLQRLSHDTAAAWDWVQKHKDSLNLKGKVCGPPILECSVIDPRYAQAVEGQLRRGDVVAITCTHKDDQKLLMNKLLTKKENGGQGLHDVHLRTSPKPLSAYQKPVSEAELTRYGFEGYMLDYLQGPDEVLAMLCDNNRLHQIAYAANPISDEQHEAVTNSPIHSWVSGVLTNRVVRRYGQASTSVTKLRPAQFFVDQPANADEMRELEQKQRELVRTKQELQEENTVVKNEMKTLNEEIAEFRQEMEIVQAEQNGIRKALAEWEALPGKIAMKQTDLDSHKQKIAETADRIRAIKADARVASLKAASLTLEYAKAVTQMRAFHESHVEAEIRFIEAKSELRGLIQENSEILQKQQAQQNRIAELDQRHQALRRDYRRIFNVTQEEISTCTEEENRMILAYKESIPSIDDLDIEIQSVTARLGMMAEGNPGAIKAYEKREEEIRTARIKLDEYARDLEQIKDEINEIRGKWEPELDRLVRKISAAFAQQFEMIGCAGDVQVNKHEADFDKWSIQISVRFRENESLSVLDSHRQSGGERSVSTVFYLMALQDLAQSPFRVVDEINQGMDPRNERMVHGRMVDIACQENTSQYFLVTPKLLPGLKYHEKMKVHIINSGEHVPVATGKTGEWNLSSMAEIALAVRRSVAVA